MFIINRNWLVLQNKVCWMRERHMTYTSIFFPGFSEHKSTTTKEHLKFLLQLILKEFIITLQKYLRRSLTLIVVSWESLMFSNKLLWNVQERKCHTAPEGAMTRYPTVKCLRSLREHEPLQEVLHLSNGEDFTYQALKVIWHRNSNLTAQV